MQDLFHAAGPADFQILNRPTGAQPKMYAAVAGGRVADCRCHLVPLLAAIFSGDMNLRADAHAVALRAYQLQQDPVVAGIGDVVQEFHFAAQYGDDHVDTTVVVNVPERDTAMGGFDLEIRAARLAGVLELPISKTAEDRVGFPVVAHGDEFTDVVENVGAGDEQIFPAVVVEVEDAVAPARHV